MKFSSPLVGTFVAQALAVDPRVSLKNGTLVGAHLDSFDQDVFLGIPFAQPPVGDLRFAPPQPLNTTWSGDKVVTTYGKACNAVGNKPDMFGIPTSEDCLTINVVRPAGYENEKLPVGVWFYGGGFSVGASSRDLYNLSYPIEQSVKAGNPVIGVSFNYRTNGFGFLASEEIASEGALNLGLRDQRLALQWVQENIEAFGGDPSKVTAWGESAGALSISYHLTAFGGRDDGLFHQAILESGGTGTNQFYSPQVNELVYKMVLDKANCSSDGESLDCLRALPEDKMIDVFNQTYQATGMAFQAQIDGDFFVDLPDRLIDQGKFVKIPLLVGSNIDEGTRFTLGPLNTTDQLVAALGKQYPNARNQTIDKLLELYPNDPALGCPFGTGDAFSNATYGFQTKRGNAIGGDIYMVGPSRRMAQNMAKHGKPVYRYQWNVTVEGYSAYQGASHTVELTYVFDNPNNISMAAMGPDPDGTKKRLGDLTSRFWMNFIAKGDPNKGNIDQHFTHWPKFNHDNKNYYFHLDGIEIQKDDFRVEAIEFINYGAGNDLLIYDTNHTVSY